MSIQNERELIDSQRLIVGAADRVSVAMLGLADAYERATRAMVEMCKADVMATARKALTQTLIAEAKMIANAPRHRNDRAYLKRKKGRS